MDPLSIATSQGPRADKSETGIAFARQTLSRRDRGLHSPAMSRDNLRCPSKLIHLVRRDTQSWSISSSCEGVARSSADNTGVQPLSPSTPVRVRTHSVEPLRYENRPHLLAYVQSNALIASLSETHGNAITEEDTRGANPAGSSNRASAATFSRLRPRDAEMRVREIE